ncbi:MULTISPECIES: hypothetical protein [Bradyrhizobium]|uniref:hypothetical protein n=1 Tax=Bradyrhizobium TaxID=374 RepID=UPI0012FDD69F|nr:MULTISPECIES: hypothetical protein [Bradyrhizobium]MBR0945913.1 hypothetical protein [Bradyrhizobium liaoningense]MBR1028311.1 hypothetical protein [Bradyrhizobium liaoningense]MDI2072374.1 hypothetical protein [Bradyrhizobium sp. Mp27]
MSFSHSFFEIYSAKDPPRTGTNLARSGADLARNRAKIWDVHNLRHGAAKQQSLCGTIPRWSPVSAQIDPCWRQRVPIPKVTNRADVRSGSA